MREYAKGDVIRSLHACASNSCDGCLFEKSHGYCIRGLVSAAADLLQNLPDPAHPAHWEKIVDTHNWSEYKCSKCGRVVRVTGAKRSDPDRVYHVYPYCHCGTRMIKEAGDAE